MTRTTPNSLQSGLAVFAVLLLAGGWSLGACGGDDVDPGEDTATGDASPADVEIAPQFTAVIVASRLSGNAPLEVDFDVELMGDVDPDTLSYTWSVDGSVAAETRTFSNPFYRSGAATVSVLVEYIGATGAYSSNGDSVVIRVQGCADLTFDRLTLEPPVEVAPGDDVTIRVARLLNEGDTIEQPFDVVVALSINEVYDPAEDLEIARWTEQGMASGLFSTSAIDYAMRALPLGEDVPEGFYYVFIVADPDSVVNECQENNNTEPSTNNLSVEADAGLKADLEITAVNLPAGLVVRQGENMNYSFTLANAGLGEATQFRIGFWLSTDPFLSPETDRVVADPAADNSKIQSLGPGASLSFFKSYRVPDDLPDGQYWLIGMADANDDVAELDEDNNVRASDGPLTMEYEEPTCYDLDADVIVVEPLSTYWDGTVQVSVTVVNPGTVPTPDGAKMRVFLSQQPSLNPSTARNVGTFLVPVIPPGESRTVVQVVPISDTLPILPHYVGVILDPDSELTECSESNNSVQFPQPITINAVASVDLEVEPIVYHPATVDAGGVVKLEYAVSNNGTSGATAFELGFVLSPDASITRAGINSGADILIGTAIVSSVPADSSVPRIDDVVIPVALDHTVTTYHLGVIADLRNVIGQDTVPGNNIEVASQVLTVVGAEGGCYEDELEDNDAIADAVAIAPAAYADLGLCGDADWFTVDVPAGHSLVVDVAARPILAMTTVPSDVILELRTPSGALFATSDTQTGLERVRAYAVDEAGAWVVSVRGRSAPVRAAYDLDVAVVPPPAGAELLAHNVQASPSSGYPGGPFNVGWTSVNTGLTAAGAHRVRVWASQDTTLDLAGDVPVAEATAEAIAPLTSRVGSISFVLPSTLTGGDWFFLVEIDADDDVAEAVETNNVAWGPPTFLDADKTCDDDDLEPNDERRIATPLTLVDGAVTLTDRVVCPGLPDWYAVWLEPGDELVVTADYPYTSSKGLLQVDLWDPSSEAQILSAFATSSPTYTLPWSWLSGLWFIGVENRPQGSNVAAYTYDLTVTVGPGAEEAMCMADAYEDNNGFTRAKAVGCGVLTATMCNADSDIYLLNADEGVEVRLTMDHPNNETRTRIFTDPTANPVRTRNGNGLLTYTPTASDDGPLYVEISPRSGPVSMTQFPYDLTIEGIAGIDLSVVGPTPGASSVVQGEDVFVSFDVVNGCTEDAVAFEATVWLSRDPVLDGTDVDIAYVTLTEGLAAEASASFVEKVTVPLSTAPGSYYLIVEADSGQVVAESNEQNNVGAAPIEVAEVCLPDLYEPNDFFLTLDDVPVVAAPGADGLTICPFDQDWLQVEAPAGATLTVAILFSHDEGDLDLRLYDPSLSTTTPVASSTSGDDDEVIVHQVGAATTFLVRVAGFQGASAGYDLVIELD